MMDALMTSFLRGSRGRNPGGGYESYDELDSGIGVDALEIDGGGGQYTIPRFRLFSLPVAKVYFTVDFLGSLRTVAHGGDETSCLSNKLNELSLAAFDDSSICISQPGSWAFSN